MTIKEKDINDYYIDECMVRRRTGRYICRCICSYVCKADKIWTLVRKYKKVNTDNEKVKCAGRSKEYSLYEFMR